MKYTRVTQSAIRRRPDKAKIISLPKKATREEKRDLQQRYEERRTG